MHSHTTRRGRLVLLAVLATVVALTASASAGAVSTDEDSSRAATSTSKVSVKSLKKQLKKLTKRVIALEQKEIPGFPDSLPPKGPARGDLAGTYPNPTIANNVIKPGHIPDETLTGFEIAPDSLHANDLATDSVGATELKGTHVVVSNGVGVGAGGTGTATVACPAGELVTGGGHSWQNDTSSRIVYSTPVEFASARTWTVQGFTASANTLFAWAVCLPA